MTIREFIIEWRGWGLRVALYNLAFTWLHCHDRHVRVWDDEGET